MESSNRAVYVAIASDLAITMAKFVAAAFTASASMLAEGIHSLVETANNLLLLWGRHAYRRPPDKGHPFGHGKELYFWTLVVALLIFSAGGGVTIVEGIERLMDPQALKSPVANYAVLGVAAIFEGVAATIAYRNLRARRPEAGLWQTIRDTKDPTVPTVLLQNGSGLLGVVVAFVGVFLGHLMGNPYPDAIASLVIGLILAAVAIVLTYESKKLLVGESAQDEAVRDIRAIVEGDSAIAQVGDVLTMHLGPDDVLATLDVRFHPDVSAAELARAADCLGAALHERHPEVRRVYLRLACLANGSRPESSASESTEGGTAFA
jgi:cation diffusion facilitator family transporter